MPNVSAVPLLLKHRVDKTGKSQIVIRVYLDGKVVCNDNTGKKIESAHWDTQKREVKKSGTNFHLINGIIKKRVAYLEHEFLQRELQGVTLTSNKIKNICKGEDTGHDFIAYCTARIPEKYSGPSQKETRRSYLGEVSKLKAFQNDISFGDIDSHFLSRYKAWLINKRANSANTVWKALKFINTMINDAIPVGYIKDNPFKHFDRGQYVQGKRDFLDLLDCDKIHKLLLTDIPDRLRLVAGYYLFMCYTGFRFQDATKFFNYDTHVIDNERIIFDTQKTGTEVNILIHSRLRMILDIIKHSPLQITNKEFNSYTKVLATMAGISIKTTAHTGRHTFGATLAELDVPIEKAQKLLGHKDRRSTEIYYHIKNKSLDKEMEKWDQP